MDCSLPGFCVHQQLPELLRLMPIELVMPPSNLIPCCPLLLLLSVLTALGSFPMSQFFASGGHRIGTSFSASVLPINIQDWFPLGLTGWISLWTKGLKSILQHQGSKPSILQCSAFFKVQLSHSYMNTGKTIALIRRTFIYKVVPLIVNILSTLVIVFLPKSKHILISWLQSPNTVILEPKKMKSVTVSIVSLSICHGMMGPDAIIFIFWMLNFFSFIFISWRLITLQYCSGFCHTLTWISDGFTCVPQGDWDGECWVLSQVFTLLFHFHQEVFKFLFIFCHKGGVNCISEVIDISPGNLDSSLCFIQSGISHIGLHIGFP